MYICNSQLYEAARFPVSKLFLKNKQKNPQQNVFNAYKPAGNMMLLGFTYYILNTPFSFLLLLIVMFYRLIHGTKPYCF